MSDSQDKPRTLRELLAAMKTGFKVFAPIMVRVQEDALAGGDLTGERTISSVSSIDWGQQYAQEYAEQEFVFLGENSLEGIKRQATLLGRSSACDIQIEAASVSKQHASITFDRDRGSYSITDNNSSNGTMVNGEQLVAGIATALWAGAYISFGEAVYIFFDTPTLRRLAKSYEGG